ncbi:MAG: bifunctional 2-C-methyl-D-erythritol 4-phosphate cytidylyltransferase/2-C-methyl-D-erythritol 2,4-cyclodiphosphate synthase [Azospirillaceae bacterium]|nr:bifunctional 2-C-methyl-D-erythritol 4-phosphate cytidylyltransferase/2-C-methyl-D-erythritol 2,4-cyclodiphosphate synthase [Azospirillaceae bacterium]
MPTAVVGADCAAVIVAGGSGSRFGGECPKQYQTLLGQPVLRHTVRTFLSHPAVDRVIVVIRAEDRALYDEAVAGFALLPPVTGGVTRQESVHCGLEALDAPPPRLVLIHDAARPLVDAATISAVIAKLAEVPAALAAIPITDTVKRAPGGLCRETVDRTDLWRAATPQGFRFAEILAAHRQFADAALTDDAALAERAGLPIAVVRSNPDNLKITMSEDLPRCAAILAAALPDIRTGQGFDVHRFAPGDHVVLCGVSVPHSARLDGHSDADVALHALTDAILGALAEGDIGSHFPPSDPQWRGADSALFLRHAVQRVTARGGLIAHVDVTIICERPKVGPHRPAMITRLAELLGIAADRVSVKGTTTERLGFTGREEGIAAQATATIRLPG